MHRCKAAVMSVGTVLFTLLMFCQGPVQSSLDTGTGQGVAMMKMLAASNSSFHLIARSATVTISAPDMTQMSKALTVTDTSVEGLVTGIPAGPNRLFTVSVFDSAQVVCYRGSATAAIVPDDTVMVTLNLYRVGGAAEINGTIYEQPEIDSDNSSLLLGLMAYYPFNGNAADESGHGFDITANGAQLTTDRFGNPNKAYYFNGNATMATPVTPVLSLSKFTLCVWMKSSVPGSYLPRLVAVGIPGQAQNYYGLLYSNGVYAHAPALSRQIIFMNGDPQDYFSYELQYSHGAIDTLTWHHAAVSYDSGRLRFYIDGALDKDTVISTVIYQFSTTADLTIGCSDGPDRFVGKLDDVRIYNRALSDQEIKSIYSLLN